MITKQTFKIFGMHCASCAMNIDGALEDSAGVVKSSTSYAKQLVEVEFDQDKINQEKIKEIIQATGYEVVK